MTKLQAALDHERGGKITKIRYYQANSKKVFFFFFFF